MKQKHYKNYKPSVKTDKSLDKVVKQRLDVKNKSTKAGYQSLNKTLRIFFGLRS